MKDRVDAAALAAQRWAKVGALTCARCGKSFEGRTARKGPRYCSGTCRTLASRARVLARAAIL